MLTVTCDVSLKERRTHARSAFPHTSDLRPACMSVKLSDKPAPPALSSQVPARLAIARQTIGGVPAAWSPCAPLASLTDRTAQHGRVASAACTYNSDSYDCRGKEGVKPPNSMTLCFLAMVDLAVIYLGCLKIYM